MSATAAARTGIASFPPVLKTNPYQRLLYTELEELGFPLANNSTLRMRWLWRARKRVRFLHFHWVHGYYRFARGPGPLCGVLSWVLLAAFAGRLVLARALGYRVVWTVHQVFPHEKGNVLLDRSGRRILAALATTLLAHDVETAGRARSAFASRRVVHVVPHGSYVGVYPERRARAAVRGELGIPEDARALLCFGDLRGYKDVELLLGAFADAAHDGLVLVVAGSPRNASDGDAVRAAAADDPRIFPVLRFVPDDAVAELFHACDVAVIARGDGGTSGSLILALSMGMPTIAADTGAYRELVGVDAGWLFRPGDRASLAAAIGRAASEDGQRLALRAAAASARVAQLDWRVIATQTAQILTGERR